MDVGVLNDINLSIGGVDGCHAITGSFPNKDTLPTIAPYALAVRNDVYGYSTVPHPFSSNFLVYTTII